MNRRQFDDDSRALSAPVPCGSIVQAMPVPTTKIRASANRPSRTHHRNSQRFESLRRRHIHIAEPIWMDCWPALADQIHNGSSLFVTDVSTPKTPLRRVDRLALTVEVHSDRSVCATHISTSRTALRWIVSRPSPNNFATIRAFSHPTSAHRKPCLDDVVALAHRRNAQRSECPCRRHIHIGCAATENRPFTTHRSNSQQAESPRGSHAHVKAAHKRKASCS